MIISKHCHACIHLIQFTTIAFILPVSAGFDIYGTLNKAKDFVYEQVGELCTDYWIPADIDELSYQMNKRLYGQNIVRDVVLGALGRHARNPQPDKPLVMSFHGSTGIGKNYLSKMIVESYFRRGHGSRFFTAYNGRLDFPRADKLHEYQEKLHSEIKEKVSKCSRHIFVFDEVDKIPAGVLNILKPFVDYNVRVNNVDFRKCVFIFLSNIGQEKIVEHHLDLWSQGHLRSKLRYNHFEQVVKEGAFNLEGGEPSNEVVAKWMSVFTAMYKTLLVAGGFQHSDNIKHQLVDYFVPFLSLERDQIKDCISYEFRTHGNLYFSDKDIESILEQVEYFPEHQPIFAKTGCKGLAAKVSMRQFKRRSEL